MTWDSVRRAVGVAACVTLAAAALAALRWTTPSYATLTGPIPVAGRQGERAEGRAFAVTVETIELAGRVRVTRFGRTVERTTDGVFAVVTARVEAGAATTSIGAAAWIGPSGRVYAQTQRIDGASSLLMGRTIQPGLPRSGVFVFELPADEVEGGALRLSRFPEPRLDSELWIALSTGDLPKAVSLELPNDG